MPTKLFLVLLLTFVFTSLAQADDQPASAETRMRQVLRDTMGQLRDAQNQVVTLQATQAQSDKDKADLQAKLDALTAQLKTVSDQAAADKAASDKMTDDFKSQVADQKGQIDRLTDGLKQWKDAYNQAAQLAASKEAARAEYAVKTALVQRTLDTRDEQNLALYKLGKEILTRYEQFGLGDAIAAKEPFVGLSRVKLENLVQDYKNKLLDQAATTGQTVPPAPAPSTPAPAPANSTAGKADKTNAAPPKPANET
jgi:DNA repair exonuclease SbcCD ATPase subunit